MKDVINCPNCGGIVHDCICDYCGAVLPADVHNLIGRRCVVLTLDDKDDILAYGVDISRIEDDADYDTYYTDNTMYHIISSHEIRFVGSLQDSQSMSNELRVLKNIFNTRLKNF